MSIFENFQGIHIFSIKFTNFEGFPGTTGTMKHTQTNKIPQLIVCFNNYFIET